MKQLFGTAVLISAAQAISLKHQDPLNPDIDTVLHEVFRNNSSFFPKTILVSSMGTALWDVSEDFYNYFLNDFPMNNI